MRAPSVLLAALLSLSTKVAANPTGLDSRNAPPYLLCVADDGPKGISDQCCKCWTTYGVRLLFGFVFAMGSVLMRHSRGVTLRILHGMGIVMDVGTGVRVAALNGSSMGMLDLVVARPVQSELGQVARRSCVSCQVIGVYSIQGRRRPTFNDHLRFRLSKGQDKVNAWVRFDVRWSKICSPVPAERMIRQSSASGDRSSQVIQSSNV